MGSPQASIVSVKKLKDSEYLDMFIIFSKYYENVDYDTFISDLKEKNDVIVLKAKNKIVGFSTLLCKKIIIESREVLGVYSGDTIMEKEYWGSPALGKSFLKYLWIKKLQNFTTPVYWFLISKGYKTYLLMANNFSSHFPNIDEVTPSFEKQLMDNFYGSRFPENYVPEKGIIHFAGDTCKLKGAVAPITQEMCDEVPKINFFVEKNPNWHEGQELACLARMTLLMPLKYSLKKLIKTKTPSKSHSKLANNKTLNLTKVS